MTGINFFTGKFSNFTKSIECVINEYETEVPEEIIIMTDGAENIYMTLDIDSKVTLINVGEDNDQLKNLCKLEKANYLQL